MISLRGTEFNFLGENMKIVSGLFLATSALMLAANISFADPKPKGAKPSDSQTIANFYAGSTRIWKSCNGGGIYLGGGWEAQAYCNKNSPSVGWGKWSVKKGKLCSQVVWHWKENGEPKSKEGDQDCIAHVTAPDGQIWRRWNDDKDWWRSQDIKDDKNAVKGFKFKGKFNRTKKKNGV